MMDMSIINHWGSDPYRGLGRSIPHLMPMLGQWICFLMKPSGSIKAIGSGPTPEAAYKAMYE